MTRGLFIVFEGGEGAGKTTQVARLAHTIASTGRTVVTTREPGGTTIGQYLRSLLLTHRMPSKTEALLYLADRSAHVAEVVRPALDRGDVVVSDRYADSTCIYQGLGRGLGAEQLAIVSDWATDALAPDVVVVLDIDPRIGLGRVQATRGRHDRIEAEGLDFHDRVRLGFLTLAQDGRAGTRYVVVDADQQVDLVAAEVASAVQHVLTPDVVVA